MRRLRAYAQPGRSFSPVGVASKTVRGRPLFVEAIWAQVSQPRSVFKLWLLFSAELALIAILRLPVSLSFNAYAFADRGSFMTACYLAAHGGHPAIDFGYPYGLLALLSAQAWFRVFGLTPQADELAMLVCGLFGTWAMARFANRLRLGLVGIALLVVAMPFAILPSYQSFVYALEIAILSNALAEQAADRRASALALATAACLVKASMGYVYGLLLLIFILCDSLRVSSGAEPPTRWLRVVKSLAPAAVTGTTLIAVLTAVYGIPSVIVTVVPIWQEAMYRFLGLGSVFRSGRGLWYEPKAGIDFYLFTVAGLWIMATLWLVMAGLNAGRRVTSAYWIHIRPHVDEEFVFTCALLHVVFISIFFGGGSSWQKDSYLLIMGAAATSINSALSARVTAGLAAMALFGNLGHVQMALYAWHTTSPGKQTAGLWATAQERNAWEKVLAVTAGRNAVVLTFQGGAAVIFTQFEPPIAAYLLPKEKPSDVPSTANRLRRAPMIFAVTDSPYAAALVFFPQLRRLLNERKVMLTERGPDGVTFSIYGPRRQLRGTP